MVFKFIEDAAAVTEVEVLCMIYNLMLMMSIFAVCIVGLWFTYIFLKKGVYNK